MRVNKNDLDRMKYLERELKETNTHLAKVIASIIHNVQVNNSVYVITEEGSWDYENTLLTEIYASYEEALKRYNSLKKTAQDDMKEWDDESGMTVENEQIDQDAESAEFQIYQDGDYTRFHDTITITRKEVLENADTVQMYI